MESGDVKASRQLRGTDLAVLGLSIIGLVGVLVFGLPSPDDRPKVYELLLAAFWTLITIAHIGTYANWKRAPWPRRMFSIAAPLIALLYLQKYFWS